jgi:biopolymer transport protein ExbB/TolQ
MNKLILIGSGLAIIALICFGLWYSKFELTFLSSNKQVPASNDVSSNRLSDNTNNQHVATSVSNTRRYRWGWIIPLGIGAVVAFYIIKRNNSESTVLKAGPLLLPQLALLFLFVCLVTGVTIPAVQETLQLMLYEKSGICIFILILMIVGIGINIYQFIFLSYEYWSFRDLEENLDNTERMNSAEYQKIQQLMELSARGIFKEKWSNIKKSIDCIHYSDFELLMSYPREREELKESKISFIIKTLPLLGMIGTVTGFILAVAGMQGAASNMVDFSSFKGHMIGSLDGMQNAFLTTLAGMVGMVVVMLLNSLLAETRKRILLFQDEFLYIKIYLPYLKFYKESQREEKAP